MNEHGTNMERTELTTILDKAGLQYNDQALSTILAEMEGVIQSKNQGQCDNCDEKCAMTRCNDRNR